MRTHVRCYAELVDLSGEPEIEVLVGSARSVKDLVESIGVPHVEVGLLVVDGRAVGFEHQVAGGERVAVYPPFHGLRLDPSIDLFPPPPDPRRFVLDVHLGTLARRLRLLGFDTWYRTGTHDTELARVATDEDRILLSRDRGLLMRRSVVHGYCPRSDDPRLQALEVADRYDLGPRVRPYTRCIPCNGRLLPVSRDDVLEVLPPRTRVEHDRFVRCEGCDQVYWPGSHVDAMATFVDDVRNGPQPRGDAAP
jgi:uncharacterized protein